MADTNGPPREVIDSFMLYITVRGPAQYNINSNHFFTLVFLFIVFKFSINATENKNRPESNTGPLTCLFYTCIRRMNSGTRINV